MTKIYGETLHHNRSPWDQAPPWAIELRELIIETRRELMSADQDLNNAVTALAAGFTALDTAVAAELATLASQSTAAADLATFRRVMAAA